MKWNKGFAMIAVESSISGHFATHTRIDGSGEWVLTHIPSGFQIIAGIIDEETAKDIAERIKHLNWNFEKAEQLPPDTKAKMGTLLPALRKLCKGELPKDGADRSQTASPEAKKNP